MLQLGTPDVASCPLDELIPKYKKLIETVKETAPKAQIIKTAFPHCLTAESLDANQKADCLNNFIKSSKQLFLIALLLEVWMPIRGLTVLISS